ncbi:MAG: hybrid sensor histidine kinase/response regulator [Desulfomonilia bacterium]
MSVADKKESHLYNIRIIKTYLEFIKHRYPDLDIDALLSHAGLSRSELDDEGYWYTQDQANRFHEMLQRMAGQSNIAREAGRYAAVSASYGTIRRYIFGFMNPTMAYELMARIGSKLTKGTEITINKLASNKVEAIFDINPGVNEKPYQCENRYGMMEAMSKVFTGEYATVEHLECIHKGATRCRYYISWVEPLSSKINRIRNYIILLFIPLIVILPSFFTGEHALIADLVVLCAILGISGFALMRKHRELEKRIEDEGSVAEQLMAESDKRYSDAELIQEIGESLSSVFDIDELLRTVMTTLEKHLDYERGMVLLANEEKNRLIFRSGYGYSPEQVDWLRAEELHLDKPDSKGPFVVAFKEQKTFLIDDVEDIVGDMSERSRNLVKFSGARSFICVPIVYENESLGVLSVDNTAMSGPPRQSDLNLLMGIAPQIAVSINNVRTFEKMQASEEKYRLLVESANSIILRVNSEGRITFVNSFAQKFYGYSEEELLDKHLLGLIIPNRDSKGRELSTLIEDFLKNPELYGTLESENVRKGGERVWVTWSNKAIYDKDGTISEILCVGNDITARKKAEEEKKQLEAQLVRSQKMEAIGALAGGVAHDLNNILSGITSYPDLLLMEIPETSPMRKAIITIKKSGEKAAAIVQDLLTLARRGVSISNVVDINTIVSDYFESPEFQRLVEYHPHIEFSKNLNGDSGHILGSEVHLGKTVMNLVSNAAEAMPKGGSVTVSTSRRCVENPIKGFDTVEPGEYVVLSVEDTGIGISEEDLKRIFEPFFTKKVMGRSGTGLGMTVVWSTVKDHHGYIDVKSTEGKGTSFSLYFPVTLREMKDRGSSMLIEEYMGRERVLVVDDSEDQRDIASTFLGRLGYDVAVASNGESAVEYLKHNPVEIVLLDMIMEPGIDGLDTYRKILEINPDQNALIVSGFSETDRVKQAIKLGAGGYIRKPYALKELARAVRTELDRK